MDENVIGLQKSSRSEAAILHRQRTVLEDYLRVMLELRDWHGVRDACVDIEKIEAQLELLNV